VLQTWCELQNRLEVLVRRNYLTDSHAKLAWVRLLMYYHLLINEGNL